MTEEVNGIVEDNSVDESQQEEVQYTPAEQKARGQGWVSQEEWESNGNDPDDWVDYKTFNLRGELFDKIKKQNKVLDEYRQIIYDLQEHNKKISQKENDTLKKQLRAQKEKAIEEGNGKVVAEIDEWLDELKAQPKETTSNSNPEDLGASFQKWVSDNPWYNADEELREEADSIGIAEAIKITKNQRPVTKSEAEEIYDKVTKKVKRMYPEKFQNERKMKPSAVASSNSATSTPSGKKTYTLKDVPEEYRPVVNRFVKSGVMTVHEYVKQLKDSGVI